MDKYEYNLKIDQIRQAVEKRENISAAVKIADEIDWKKEKDVSVLIVVADAYELGRQYSKAKETLLIAYEKAQGGKQLAYRLALLSTKTKEFGEAEEFFRDFVEMAPRDTSRYILRYRISKAKGDPLEHLIEILEEYVDIDMEEKWMYELAKLYHLAGDVEKCVDLCDEMSLWFAHGEYVKKAMDLKKKYKPLTKRQEENYYKTEEDFARQNKQEEIQTNVEKTEAVATEEEKTKGKQATIPFTTLKADEYKTQPEKKKNQKMEEKNIDDTTPIPGEIDIEDIHIKPLEGDGSDTMDLQAEIAKNIEEIMGSEAQMQKIKEENNAAPDKLTMTLDPLFKYDADGQIGLDIEEPKKKDKQITGQLSIEEVLRNLEERGILKADTVNKTVETMDQAAEAVDKAAEEAAVKAEIEKKNTTVIQEIEAKDLVEDGEIAEVQSALESYADDTVNGFVFTEEIDSATIEEALLDSQQKTMPESKQQEEAVAKTLDISEANVAASKVKEVSVEPVAEEAEDTEEVSEKNVPEEVTLEKGISVLEVLEEGTSGVMPGDVPVLDLSFDAPVKKIHPGIAPTSEPVAANTASLKELFADLDEATKREIGILEEEQETGKEPLENFESTEERTVPEKEKIEKTTEEEDASSEVAKEKTEEKVQSEESAKDGDTEGTDIEGTDIEGTDTEGTDTEGTGLEGTASEKTDSEETELEETESKGTVSEETDSEKTQAEETDKEETQAEETDKEETQAEETDKEETQPEVLAQEQESVQTTTQTVEEKNTLQEEPKSEKTISEVKKEDIPQVNVTTNTNLNRTMSLNLEKIIVTDEEMAPFDSFKTVNGLEQKIKDTVITLASTYEAKGTSHNGNIMILGDDKSGKTTMAIELIKLINKKRERTGRRIAKVDASVLNSRGIRSSMKKLVGSDLIVENAHHLRKTVLAEFISVGQYYTDNMLMVFEGETSALKTMRNENEDIVAMFDHVLVIKEYDVKEWVAYAKKFASTKNYMIDEMGTLALYKAIDDFYGKHQGIDQNDVEGIVSHAIKKANAKVARKFTNLFSGKNDETGMDILKEADFK